MNTIISYSDVYDEENTAGRHGQVATLDGVGQGSPLRGGDIWAEIEKTGKKHHAVIQGQSIPGR